MDTSSAHLNFQVMDVKRSVYVVLNVTMKAISQELGKSDCEEDHRGGVFFMNVDRKKNVFADAMTEDFAHQGVCSSEEEHSVDGNEGNAGAVLSSMTRHNCHRH